MGARAIRFPVESASFFDKAFNSPDFLKSISRIIYSVRATVSRSAPLRAIIFSQLPTWIDLARRHKSITSNHVKWSHSDIFTLCKLCIHFYALNVWFWVDSKIWILSRIRDKNARLLFNLTDINKRFWGKKIYYTWTHVFTTFDISPLVFACLQSSMRICINLFAVKSVGFRIFSVVLDHNLYCKMSNERIVDRSTLLVHDSF